MGFNRISVNKSIGFSSERKTAKNEFGNLQALFIEKRYWGNPV